MKMAKNENWYKWKLGQKKLEKIDIMKKDICRKWKLEKILVGK